MSFNFVSNFKNDIKYVILHELKFDSKSKKYKRHSFLQKFWDQNFSLAHFFKVFILLLKPTISITTRFFRNEYFLGSDDKNFV
jgi:hypothetical protein